MPIHHNFGQPAPGIDMEVSFSGTLTPGEILDYLRDVLSLHTDWAGKRILLTFSDDARASGFNYASLNAIANATRSFETQLTGSSIAAVSPRALFYGLLRMYLALRDPPHTFVVFRSRKAAIDWVASEVNTQNS